MREILFRGKTSDGEWVEGFYSAEEYNIDTHSIEHIPRIQLLGKCVSLGVLPETVGQFTGLTDKNGKKIFEGDIIEFHEEIGKIRYSKSDAAFDIIFDTWNTNFSVTDERRIEVIGNIHDNPELME